MDDYIENKRAHFIKTAEKLGHELYLDDNGKVDFFICNSGYHNGPGCKKCGRNWCWHCLGADDLSKCESK